MPPAACQVDPEVSSERSMSRTSRQPALVVEHAHTHYAAADDDHFCRVLHVEFSSVWVN
jgi:hypothetical protein